MERYKAQPEPADPGEDPSWLAPPSRFKRALGAARLMLLLVIAGGALLAYLLTR